jgi:guanylate kinase
LTPTQFDELVDADGLLEWARYQDHCYGTPKAHVLEKIDQGRAVVMELDVQGARQVVQRLPQARTVFLAPPSWDELERRLRGRGTESATAIERRLVVAKQELEFQNECDRVVVNREVASAVAELVNFIGLGPMGTSAAS